MSPIGNVIYLLFDDIYKIFHRSRQDMTKSVKKQMQTLLSFKEAVPDIQ